METIESNYKVSRRVYQQLYYDIEELFHEYIQSIDLYEQQDIEEDYRVGSCWKYQDDWRFDEAHEYIPRVLRCHWQTSYI